MNILDTLVVLSHEFGTTDYVRGGGGNTSCKDATTLWVKPSGTTLKEMKAGSFVAMSRAKMGELYAAPTPDDADAREALVKEMMAKAVLPDSSGRPSVEAPLHESFNATYVIHTHPALVNGMTCARDGKAVCARLFPNALWIDYTDPGYTLCKVCRDEMKAYTDTHGKQPSIVFLQNHGVFVAGDRAEDIRTIYDHIITTLKAEYAARGISLELDTEPNPPAEFVAHFHAMAAESIGADRVAAVAASGSYAVSEGPISPDHIVYSKSYHLIGDPTVAAVQEFAGVKGYLPRVIACGAGVMGVGTNEKNAALALEFSQDGALVKHLAEAFGGIQYMSDSARDFIDNWEVEAYRRQIAES
jgi:rhamnose utilization protein RhaD (predicted bifunctional aldolase and dehydrogenase)